MGEPDGPDPVLYRQAMREHGHAFHYAVIAAIERASRENGLGWRFMASEVPLSLNGDEVHADFIFQNGARFLIGECKRVNPAYSEWLFGRTRYTTAGKPTLATVEELFAPSPQVARPHVRPKEVAHAELTYQVGISVKTQKKGEGCVSDRTAIEECVKQVSRAAGGFSELCADNIGLLGPGLHAVMVPAIFTTSSLCVCNRDVELSDLATGELSPDATFSRRPWLWFQRGLNPTLRAHLGGRYVCEEAPTWSAYFARSSVRSVAIVNAGGIEHFLSHLDQW